MSHIFDCIAKNPLDIVTVGYSRRLKYADIHIAALTGNNINGIYDNLISETQTKRDALHSVVYDSKDNKTTRIAYTAEIKNITNEYRKYISKFEGYVRYKFDKATPMYVLFFANGIEHYRKATQEETVLHLENFITLNQMHKNELGTTKFIDGFTDIHNRFTSALSVQRKAMGAISYNTQAKVMMWNELKKQIYKNMLYIALQNLDTPNMLRVFDESHLLRFHRKKKEEKKEL